MAKISPILKAVEDFVSSSKTAVKSLAENVPKGNKYNLDPFKNFLKNEGLDLSKITEDEAKAGLTRYLNRGMNQGFDDTIGQLKNTVKSQFGEDLNLTAEQIARERATFTQKFGNKLYDADYTADFFKNDNTYREYVKGLHQRYAPPAITDPLIAYNNEMSATNALGEIFDLKGDPTKTFADISEVNTNFHLSTNDAVDALKIEKLNQQNGVLVTYENGLFGKNSKQRAIDGVNAQQAKYVENYNRELEAAANGGAFTAVDNFENLPDTVKNGFRYQRNGLSYEQTHGLAGNSSEGAWSGGMRAALGTAVGGAALLAAINSSRGHQNNAQLYGQQPIY